ncbi:MULTISPECIES: hypothetical protein [Clostridia]|uniref:Uncharacterized protein n=1 Tax=Lacrimispora celerecrescens TaxID=29354 RepID=A0A084JG23_9FIRM|nr:MULTISPECIES: hypothetical protein [Clostridia]MBW4845554.1 hypothetical protein [Lachnospiraceae bacterium]HBD00872.1 hypothetical protein [Lachnoclostridium sp.]HBG12747.1 hypothetical protein [Clostridium sp.]KEZ87907.1 hypothetical protein IO98_19740 [Lacrimispora celerecrescens]MSS11372.1 hypothetical protein [Clostridium sp. WB02_MRS01]
MSATIHKHIRESVLKTALLHQLRNGQKSPERTARNLEELLEKFNPLSAELFSYSDLVVLIKSCTMEECLDIIMHKLS